MNYKRLFILGFIFLLFLACDDKNNNILEEDDVPVLLSTVPANNATISPQTDSLVFTFDREITIINKTRIKLNGIPVEKATASGNTLTVHLERLKEKTEYTLVLEKNAIKANPGKLNTEPFSLTFTTDAFPPVEISSLVVKNPS
ncbi:MAG: Ig-like domain-containing protein, partial [Dysgonamonadaceae bacterium]|nr:Ig-like domain-containing protein [Dysgonamonadaceae bacterium]